MSFAEEGTPEPGESVTVMSQVGLLGRIVRDLPLEKLLSDIDHAETVGPLLDPTSWMGGRKFENAREWKELLEPLIEFKKVVLKQVAAREAEGHRD